MFVEKACLKLIHFQSMRILLQLGMFQGVWFGRCHRILLGILSEFFQTYSQRSISHKRFRRSMYNSLVPSTTIQIVLSIID